MFDGYTVVKTGKVIESHRPGTLVVGFALEGGSCVEPSAKEGDGTRAREVRKPTRALAFVLRLGLRVSFGAARAVGSGETCGIAKKVDAVRPPVA